MKSIRMRHSILLLVLLLASVANSAYAENGRWADIRRALFGDTPIADAAGVIELTAPGRAYDAAVVPITIQALQPQGPQHYIARLHLVVDNNPAPHAGTFSFNPRQGWASLETRIRINEYTHVRAIAETADGRLYMASAFVKAAGGCSAPALSDQEAALARVGKMKLRLVDPIEAGTAVQAQVLISHPNNSGMQFDQLSRTYIPAYYVNKIDIRYDNEEILSVDTNFSLSENPSIHFTFVPREAGTLSVMAQDSSSRVFEQSWPVDVRGRAPG